MVKKLLLLAAIAYTLLLIFVSVIDLNGVPSLGSSFDDKIYHLLAYVALAGLWVTYVKAFTNFNNYYIVCLILVFFGIALEVVQHQINPNRAYDNLDLLANCIGVVIGTLIAARIDVFKLK